MNPDQKIQQLEDRIKYLEAAIDLLCRADRYYFQRPLQLDNANIQLSKTTGTKIATGTDQKLGFWNTTPVVRDTFHFNGTIGGTWDSVAQSTLSNLQRVLISYGLISS